MKIEFKKISFQKKPFELFYEEGESKVRFHGEFFKEEQKSVIIEGVIEGPLELVCDRTGVDYVEVIHDTLKMKITDGLYKGFDKDFDIIESYDGSVDFKALLEMEIEAIRNEYHAVDEI